LLTYNVKILGPTNTILAIVPILHLKIRVFCHHRRDWRRKTRGVRDPTKLHHPGCTIQVRIHAKHNVNNNKTGTL